MAIAIPAISDFSDVRGPISVDPDTGSTFTNPVVYDYFLPTGVSRLNYVRLQASVNVTQPNGVGVCQSLSVLSASLSISGVNNSVSVDQQINKATVTAVLDLFSDAIVEATTVVVPTPKPPA